MSPALPDPALLPWPRNTDRTTLRLLTAEDVDAMHAYRSLPEVCRFLSHDPLTREQLAARMRPRLADAAPTRERVVRGLAIVVDDRFVGDAMLRVQPGPTGGPELWIAYTLHPDVWGQGLATEVARELRDVGAEMGLHVKADAYAEHLASHRVLLKAGLTPCGEGIDRGRAVAFFCTSSISGDVC